MCKPTVNLLDELQRRRIAVDARFLRYSAPSMIEANEKSLARLAVIGDRLDSLIRRETSLRPRNRL